MKNKVIYCVYCGEKHTVKDKKCKKCKKKLDPKENMIIDYIKGKIKGDIKGNVRDNILAFLKNFIINHLYGSIFTATLIFTVVSAVVTTVNNDDDGVVTVTEKPEVLVNNLNRCIIEEAKDLVYICDDGYILDGNTCKKEEEIDAIVNNVCPSGYYLSGNTCVSHTTYNFLTRQECIAPSGDNVVGAKVENGQCLVNYCAGWTDGECSAGSMEPIDFTIISYCPAGTTSVGGVCKMLSNYGIEYSCSEGTLSNNICIVTREEAAELGCEEGYILDTECNLCVLGE